MSARVWKTMKRKEYGRRKADKERMRKQSAEMFNEWLRDWQYERLEISGAMKCSM